MTTPRFAFILFLACFFMSTLQALAREPEDGFPPAHVRAQQAALRAQRAAQAAQAAQAALQAAAQRLRDSMLTIERRYQLPAGTLGPATPYTSDQHGTIDVQLRDARMRMLPVATQAAEGYTLYASTGIAIDPETGARGLTLILFRVHTDGRVVPLGHTRVSSRRSDEPDHNIPSGAVRAAQQRGRAARAAQLAEAAQIQRDIEAALAARQAALRHLHHAITLIRARFDLPPAALGAFNPYLASQHDFLAASLRNPRTRYMPVADLSHQGYALYTTLAATNDGGVSLLMFKVYRQGGRVVPVGLAQVHRETREGRNIVQRVISQADASWETLQREFGPLDVVRP
ncbi:hypothetical protein PSEUBRA_003433 [Kalmanozyma brasiliensis GHG001]|uniref:uncharacterized protein n=1 Tax=Kalmanozyma brasiliensis (strain GHG001) TaxID=1365824 RepID=UPI002867E80B|nr:uncharacterized protein PSEUBRA_003433 [Kalmanozyma brasiliensis GHG001]KAF6767243.1 hypothetical protein PSEUBRA_003433 [Kalmanozyma brasiliensis GHG001]